MTTVARTPLRTRLVESDEFVTVLEIVPSRGLALDAPARRSLETARALAADPRIAAVSITDNAGGHAMASPVPVAEELLGLGQDVIVHVACRDRSRNALRSLGWELQARGIRNVLAVSGDYPVEGTGGLSGPVFDIDSTTLLALYRGLADEPGPDGAARAPGLYLAAAVSPFKRLEAEVLLQYQKLGLKARAGADFVIPQLGYDARKWDELLRWMRLHGLHLPVLANVYVLTRTVARLFNRNEIPGCVVSDELLETIERAAAGADKGKGFFLELAARQVAIARGLGFRGAYLAGHSLPAADVERILALAASFAPDWPALARELQFSPQGTFFVYRRDPATGLNTDDLDPRYARSLTPAARARARRRGSLVYRFNRVVHDVAFTPDTGGYRALTRLYGAVEKSRLSRPVHLLERAVKIPLFDCRDCGDCSLPDVAYLCPVSQCPKNERNGPCGGSHDGICEVLPKPCVWVRAYDRLKPYGEELAMLDRDPVVVDHALANTSAWANTFLGRDNYGRARGTARPTSAAASPGGAAAPGGVAQPTASPGAASTLPGVAHRAPATPADPSKETRP
jgi:methylenetetrahydrofolate reductase (NADPH)